MKKKVLPCYGSDGGWNRILDIVPCPPPTLTFVGFRDHVFLQNITEDVFKKIIRKCSLYVNLNGDFTVDKNSNRSILALAITGCAVAVFLLVIVLLLWKKRLRTSKQALRRQKAKENRNVEGKRKQQNITGEEHSDVISLRPTDNEQVRQEIKYSSTGYIPKESDKES